MCKEKCSQNVEIQKPVCKIMVNGPKNCSYNVTNHDLMMCTYHYNRYISGKLKLEDPECKIPDHQRCVELTARSGKRCKEKYMFEEDKMCTAHHEKRLEKEGISLYNIHEGETKQCCVLNHKSRGSKYEKDKVPIEKDIPIILILCVMIVEIMKKSSIY